MRSIEGLFHRVAVPALMLTLASCAAGNTAPGTRDQGTVSVITGAGYPLEIRRGADIRLNQKVTLSAMDTWNALPGVYEELGVEVDVRDSARKQVGASAQRFSRRILNRTLSDFFDCGLDPGLNRPLADQVPVTARVVTTVMETAEGTELATAVEGTARRSGGNAGTAPCRSTGLLEALVGEMVQLRAGEAD